MTRQHALEPGHWCFAEHGVCVSCARAGSARGHSWHQRVFPGEFWQTAACAVL